MVVETGTMISESETKQLTPNVVISELETMEAKPGRLDFSKIKSKPIEKNSIVTVVDKEDEGRWSTLTFCTAFFSIVALIAGFLILSGLFLSRKSLFGPTEYNRSNTSVGLGFIFFGKLLVYILRSFQEILQIQADPEKTFITSCIKSSRNAF